MRINERVQGLWLAAGIVPKYIMRYSRGFIYRIYDNTIYATNYDGGGTYWSLSHPYSMEELHDLVEYLDTTDVLALYRASRALEVKD
jgi:hypothetical protein